MLTSNADLHIAVASAGTGKTTFLLNTMRQFVDKGVPIERIALVTFSRAGADVLKQRVSETFNVSVNKLKNIRTIHSLSFRGIGATADIMMDAEKMIDFNRESGYHVAIRKSAEEGQDWDEIKDTQLHSLEQLYRVNKPMCEKIMENRCETGRLVRFMKSYTAFKKQRGYYDFTDLMENYLKAGITEDVDVALLDEMQDSSPMQWQVCFQAFANAKAIYCCADAKQCIYSFTGAKKDTLLNLRGTLHYLDTSWRVPSNILNFVNKRIVADMEMKDGSNCKSAHEGGEINYITTLHELNRDFHWDESYFFLVRNRSFAKKMVEWCQYNRIPYSLYGENVFSDSELVEFRQGRMGGWEQEKVLLASDMYNKGVLFRQPNVHINTIHGVKGMECDNVVLCTDISKAVASQLSIDPDSEHCVFYVGATRAKKRLYILTPQTKLSYDYLF